MELDTFDKLQKRLQELYQNKDYATALELAIQQFDRFPDNKILLNYWKLTLAVRVGDIPLALQILKETLANEIWYSEALLRKNPSLKPLQGLPEFETLVNLNQKLANKEQQENFPLFTLRPEGKCQLGSLACPLLLALHANASNAQGSMGFWRPAAIAGWLVAAPQSTQAIWKGAYVWDDHEITEKEVKKHYTTLLEGYSVDTGRVILAGHSMGAEIAMRLALKGIAKLRGFIAIGPGGPFMDELDEWEPLLQGNLTNDLRGYIIIGEEDTEILQENVLKLAEMFNQAGIDCQLQIIPRVSHNHAPEYDTCILRALDYLIS